MAYVYNILIHSLYKDLVFHTLLFNQLIRTNYIDDPPTPLLEEHDMNDENEIEIIKSCIPPTEVKATSARFGSSEVHKWQVLSERLSHDMGINGPFSLTYQAINGKPRKIPET